MLPIIDGTSARYFGRRASEDSQDYTGIIDNSFSRFGRSYIGDPADIAEELARDEGGAGGRHCAVDCSEPVGCGFQSEDA